MAWGRRAGWRRGRSASGDGSGRPTLQAGRSRRALTVRWLVSLLVVVVMLTVSLPLLRGLTGALGARSTGSTGAPGAATAPAPEVRVIDPEPVTVYRWRDASGTVHFETRPPAPGVAAEAIEMRRPPVAEVVEEPAPGAAGGRTPAALDDDQPSVYTREGMEALMERLDTTLDSLGARERTMRELEKDL